MRKEQVVRARQDSDFCGLGFAARRLRHFGATTFNCCRNGNDAVGG